MHWAPLQWAEKDEGTGRKQWGDKWREEFAFGVGGKSVRAPHGRHPAPCYACSVVGADAAL